MRLSLRSPVATLAVLSCLLALAFLGARGIWEPDEGRYTNVGLNMLHSGDWLTPRRNHETGHWTKPPLTYWAIAASVGAFGERPWAARLPAALAYLGCIGLVFALARALFPGRRPLALAAAAIYATMLMPFAASQQITTDYLLALWETLAMWAFVRARTAPSPVHGRAWTALMWAGLALAFLTKGPPGLLPLAVMLVYNALMPGPRRRTLQVSGLAVFVLLALPWYVAVVLDTPGLLHYLAGDEVVGRIATDDFGRNGEWYGWLKIYLPTLLLGTLPWTWPLLRAVRALPRLARDAWRDRRLREREAARLLLALWWLLPLAVFCLARSRLPLYLLPLFAPLALLVAVQREHDGRTLPRWRWLFAWGALLLGLKLAVAWMPTHKDSAAWAREIRRIHPAPLREVVFVQDMARYGLRLELDAEVEKISLAPWPPRERFNPEYDSDLDHELVEHEPDQLWICKRQDWPQVLAALHARGYGARALGRPYYGRLFFEVVRKPERPEAITGR